MTRTLKIAVLTLLVVVGIAFMKLCSFGQSSPQAEDSPSMSMKMESSVENKGKILYYRNPMGLPNTSPVPTKDYMGMDYLPVYENETKDEAGTDQS
jgi:hypothetical protein